MSDAAQSSHPTSPSLGAPELLYGDFPAEYATTRTFLERYPDGKGEWRPHARSRTLADLATHVADVTNRGTMLLESDGIEMGARPPLAPLDSAAGLLAYYDAALGRFVAALSVASYEHLDGQWAMRRGDKVILQAPRRILLRQMMMSHLIHHRAQLGVYYRLIGVRVPGAYGPSADD